jgi:hypothetical protein
MQVRGYELVREAEAEENEQEHCGKTDPLRSIRNFFGRVASHTRLGDLEQLALGWSGRPEMRADKFDRRSLDPPWPGRA